MQRIVIAVALSGLVAACGQQAPAAGEKGTPVAGQLDYIDAVPIDEDAPAPVAQPQTAAKKEEPEEDEATVVDEEKAETPAVPAASPPARPDAPAAPANDAAAATRRANEAVAPRSATEAPYSPN